LGLSDDIRLRRSTSEVCPKTPYGVNLLSYASYIKDDTEDDDQPRLEEVFTIFRYTVMGCVFKTLKLLRILTEKYASNYIRLLLLTTP
jgi:hypothetical protein